MKSYNVDKDELKAFTILKELRDYIDNSLEGEACKPNLNVVFDGLHQTKMLDCLQNVMETSNSEEKYFAVAVIAQVSCSENDSIIRELYRREFDLTAIKCIENASRDQHFSTMRNGLWLLANLYVTPYDDKKTQKLPELLERIILAVQPHYRIQPIACKFVQLMATMIQFDREVFAPYFNQRILEVILGVLFEVQNTEQRKDCMMLLTRLTRLRGGEDEQPFAKIVLYLIGEGLIERFLKSLDATNNSIHDENMALFWRLMYNFGALDDNIEVDRVGQDSPRS